MLRWKAESNGETALLIEGPRRVGKSTIVKQFAKNEYDRYLIHTKDLRKDGPVTKVPIYMTGLL